MPETTPKGSRKFEVIADSRIKPGNRDGEEKRHMRFILHGSPRKRFTAVQDGNPDIMRWHRQTNFNDCGPCLLLNVLAALRINGTPLNIGEMRKNINAERRDRGLPPLAEDSWITSDDLGRSLARLGHMNVKEFPVFPNESGRIYYAVCRAVFGPKPPVLVYLTTGSHFRGIMPQNKPDRYMLLDSFLGGPVEVRGNDARELLRATVLSRSASRIERIGIATIGSAPGYSIVTL